MQEIDGVIYITAPWRGDDPEREKWPKFKSHFKEESILPDDYNKLLFSTIGLVNKPNRWDWDVFTFCDLDWHKSFIDAIQFDRVGQWLTDYGLPSFDTELYQRGYWGYPLKDFKVHVGTIFLMYQTYSAVMDRNDPKQLALDLTNQPLLYWNSGATPDLAGTVKKADFQRKILNGDIENAVHSAQFIMGVILDRQVKNITLNYSFADSRFYWHASSLFDICYYQIAALTTLDLNEFQEQRRNIKTCEHCNSLFWGHGNRRYCYNCDRRTVWKRRHRK